MISTFLNIFIINLFINLNLIKFSSFFIIILFGFQFHFLDDLMKKGFFFFLNSLTSFERSGVYILVTFSVYICSYLT